METSRFVKLSESVFQVVEDPAVINDSDVESLVQAAAKTQAGRARILLHEAAEDTFHEMVIALPYTSCDHPHINFKSGKSFLAMSGTFAVVTFSDDGQQSCPHVVSADLDCVGKIVRLNAAVWHTIIPLRGDVVFLESIAGPFEGNRFADWFPQSESEEYAGASQVLRDISERELHSMTTKS
jgi:cupin fold WbuC family metalloprotein